MRTETKTKQSTQEGGDLRREHTIGVDNPKAVCIETTARTASNLHQIPKSKSTKPTTIRTDPKVSLPEEIAKSESTPSNTEPKVSTGRGFKKLVL